jgi:hypothetical protein
MDGDDGVHAVVDSRQVSNVAAAGNSVLIPRSTWLGRGASRCGASKLGRRITETVCGSTVYRSSQHLRKSES